MSKKGAFPHSEENHRRRLSNLSAQAAVRHGDSWEGVVAVWALSCWGGLKVSYRPRPPGQPDTDVPGFGNQMTLPHCIKERITWGICE